MKAARTAGALQPAVEPHASISTADVQKFAAEGWLVVPDVFPSAEMAELAALCQELADEELDEAVTTVAECHSVDRAEARRLIGGAVRGEPGSIRMVAAGAKIPAFVQPCFPHGTISRSNSTSFLIAGPPECCAEQPQRQAFREELVS